MLRIANKDYRDYNAVTMPENGRRYVIHCQNKNVNTRIKQLLRSDGNGHKSAQNSVKQRIVIQLVTKGLKTLQNGHNGEKRHNIKHMVNIHG